MVPVRASHVFGADPRVVRAFVGDPRGWLPPPASVFGPTTWTIGLRAGPIHRNVAISIGRVWRHGESAWRAVRWEPVEDGSELFPLESLLPVFVGELGLVPEVSGDVRLHLRGSYAPPGGLAGAVADQAGLHRVAQRTADRLVRDIASRLQPPDEEPCDDEAEGAIALGTTRTSQGDT